MKKKKRRQKRGRVLSASAIQELEVLIADMPRQSDLLIEYLHRIQDHFNCLPVEQLHALAVLLKLSQVEVYEVASFYHHFDVIKEGQEQPAKLTVRVCDSISCSMNGSEELISQLKKTVGKYVRIQRVPCVGRCDSAPVAVVGTKPVPLATKEKVNKEVKENNTADHAPDSAIKYDEYGAKDGYQLYQKLLNNEIESETILSALEDSGLRG